MNTNGKNPIGEVQVAQSRGTTAALVGIAALVAVSFLAGVLIALLVGRPALLETFAACIR